MNNTIKNIFRAVHEGKWVSIEYKNIKNEISHFWIGIRDINCENKVLIVDGLNISTCSIMESKKIYINSIISSDIIEGSYQPINKELIDDIELNTYKYKSIFNSITNLKVLCYLSECNKLDTVHYIKDTDFSKYLVSQLDGDKLDPTDGYKLTDEQFKKIVSNYQYKIENKPKKYLPEICMNMLSIHTKNGLYVLAFKRLNLDVNNRILRPEKEISIHKEFKIDGTKDSSIKDYLDGDDYYILNDFELNKELIKNKITESNPSINGVDDNPYILSIAGDIVIDLDSEYEGIYDMCQNKSSTVPIKAFFGKLTSRPRRTKNYPITLINNKVNLDQLLAINNAVKYPLTYIQGPPGTGKTNTIINTISTAFFNEKTVLFSSNNNHPLDSVFETLSNLEYHGKKIPLPVIRLGNNFKVSEALDYITDLYNRADKVSIYENALLKDKQKETAKTSELSELLKKHEKIIQLNERKEAMYCLLNSGVKNKIYQDLTNRQLKDVDDIIMNSGDVTNEDVLSLISNDDEAFRKYLYYSSARYIKRLSEPKYEKLLEIIKSNSENRVDKFNKYLSNDDNFSKFIRIFPIVITTCISAHKLGEPKPYFDLVIMDEASQCNTAVSLVPIIRGNNLMLVGDPQQLNPVIELSAENNETLKKKYSVADEYDYIKNSIYKTYLGCDALSYEILLSRHYRSHNKIISFNNEKYYNGKLKIMSNVDSDEPLVYCNIGGNTTDYKNTAPSEVTEIINQIKLNPDKKIGVITPFVNQRDLIKKALSESNLPNVECGTVHSFQGDEKDVIIFSLAITDKTSKGTYDWLKNNRELINVATSRPKEKLVVLSNAKQIERLHSNNSDADDLYDLIKYVSTNGVSTVTRRETNSRALGIKPFSTETENAFLTTLEHALGNLEDYQRYIARREVGISHVFRDNITYDNLFYSGRFDFVVYKKSGKYEYPILAIELDGKEHHEDSNVMRRDARKKEICKQHGFELIRVENSYARRYNYIKDILVNYFENAEDIGQSKFDINI